MVECCLISENLQDRVYPTFHGPSINIKQYVILCLIALKYKCTHLEIIKKTETDSCVTTFNPIPYGGGIATLLVLSILQLIFVADVFQCLP